MIEVTDVKKVGPQECRRDRGDVSPFGSRFPDYWHQCIWDHSFKNIHL